jgi:hypothetical protein
MMRARVAFVLIACFLCFCTPRFDGALFGRQSPSGTERAHGASGQGSFRAAALPLINKYCVGCHGMSKPKGGLNLAAFQDESSARAKRKTWERVLEYVEGGVMPPEDRPQPSHEEAGRFVAWLKSALKPDDCGRTFDPGRVTIRRLNRAEYNNTIRDLVGIDFRPADDFPSDDVGYGFDNIGDVLCMPPILMEKYLAAAETISEEAILVERRGGLTPRRRQSRALFVW